MWLLRTGSRGKWANFDEDGVQGARTSADDSTGVDRALADFALRPREDGLSVYAATDESQGEQIVLERAIERLVDVGEVLSPRPEHVDYILFSEECLSEDIELAVVPDESARTPLLRDAHRELKALTDDAYRSLVIRILRHPETRIERLKKTTIAAELKRRI